MQQTHALTAISDDALVRRLTELVQQSCRVESELVAHVAEVDERRLYARYASPSMFAYCTDVLHLSEAEAYLRITVARVSREHPVILKMLADGRLHLSGIALLSQHLTAENRETLLARATHASKRRIQELIAEIAPRPDAPALVRRLPERRTPSSPVLLLPTDGVSASGAAAASGSEGAAAVADVGTESFAPGTVAATRSGMGNNVTFGSACASSSSSLASPLPVPVVSALPASVAAHPPSTLNLRPSSPAIIQPLSPSRYKVQFTASAELRDKLERLRALLRLDIPDGDLGTIVERAVSETLARLEARRFASTRRPRTRPSQIDASPSSRHIPAAVRRAVRERDGNQCCYVDEAGRRCSERGRLEYHHRHPLGLGGSHSVKNVCLMCRAHNGYLAQHDYGREAMARHRRSIGRASGTPTNTSALTPIDSARGGAAT